MTDLTQCFQTIPARTRSLLGVTIALVGLLLPSNRAVADIDYQGKVPPVELVQARMWKNMKLADFRLEGEIRTENDKHKKNTHKIILRTRGYEMIYEFVDLPLQIRVLIDPTASTVEKRSKETDPWVIVSNADKIKTILDTDITYEDLCMDFIRWEKVTPLGTDNIKTLPTWAFEAIPTTVSRYTKARYWISTEYYAFMRVDAYNKEKQVIKRVEVMSVQQIGKSYAIKEMMISNLIPGREVSKTQTWIDIDTGKEDSSGLRTVAPSPTNPAPQPAEHLTPVTHGNPEN